MIAALRGKLLTGGDTHLVVDVQGVGYRVQVPARTWQEIAGQDEVFLHVHTSVREDAITLYGFAEEQERELFVLLISVSGIGPKLALAILSALNVADLCAAIQERDLARLTTVSGVGKKTAQRLCMELGEKVGGFADPEGAARPAGPAVLPPQEGLLEDAASALINLGYPRATAWQALQTVRARYGADAEPPGVEELIRQALQLLA